MSGRLILTKNYKNIMNAAWSGGSSASWLWLNAAVVDESGTSYPSSSIYKSNINQASYLKVLATLGSGAIGTSRKKTSLSSYDSMTVWYEIGYESADLTENSYNTNRTAASVTRTAINNSSISGIYTVTNNTDSNITINTISSYLALSCDSSTGTASDNTKNVLISAYQFDDIVIPPSGSAAILCDFE